MSRRTYLTSYFKDNGKKRCGPDIEADSWAEAEEIARQIEPGLVVIGKLAESIPVTGLVVGRA